MKHPVPLSLLIKEKASLAEKKLKENFKQHWIKYALLVFGLFLLSKKDLSIDFQLSSILEPQPISENVFSSSNEAKAVNTSLYQKTEEKNKGQKTVVKKASKPKKLTAAQLKKRKRQEAYVKKYVDVAKKEMKKYGIPASITLAQGLLESAEGQSRLATSNNNHFGIKCFSKSCKKGHCSNFTDDSHKDFFRIYSNSWESYRAHSELLQKSRYKKLYKLRKSDYKGWARGLKSAGYATDKRYAEKLIRIIEDLDLDKYDG